MNILVCISHVPDTTSKINFTEDNTKFDTNGVQFVINPHDEFTLTRAILIKEKQGAKVTLVNVGGIETETTLRRALAIGADEIIRINAQPTDAMMVAKELAEVVKKGNYDLVLTGKESVDYNGQMVPGMLASLLDYPFINGCIGLDIESTTLTAKQEIDGGEEIVSVTLPAVIAGQKGIIEESELKIPNMRGIMMARKVPVQVIEPIGASSITTIKSFEKPATKGAVKMVKSVDELIDLLHTEAKVI